jgi:hypothetical protein
MADDVVQAVIALVEAVLAQIVTYLSTPIDDVPLIGGILRHLGVDDTTTVGHMFTLLAMFPTTLVLQLSTDGATTLFPADVYPTSLSVAATADLALRSSPSDVATGLKLGHGVVRILQGLVDSVADYQAFSSNEDNSPKGPLKWATFADNGWALVVAAFTWPGILNKDGTSGNPYTNDPPTATLADRLTLAKWSLASLAPVWGIGWFWCNRNTPSRSQSIMGPLFTTAVFAGVLGCGIAANYESGKDDAMTQAITALEVTPRVCAPLVTKAINDTALNLPIVVKMIMDMDMEAIAGVLITRQAALAFVG